MISTMTDLDLHLRSIGLLIQQDRTIIALKLKEAKDALDEFDISSKDESNEVFEYRIKFLAYQFFVKTMTDLKVSPRTAMKVCKRSNKEKLMYFTDKNTKDYKDTFSIMNALKVIENHIL